MRLLALIFLAGCGGFHYDGHFANVTSYPVHASTRTAEGIAVDGDLDLAALDAKTDAVEACLRAKFPDGHLPGALSIDAHCLSDRVDLDVHRDLLTVKVAPDWHVGCQGMQQFPCSVDPALCEDKGFTPTTACPCECRSAIQDNDVIVVTPNLLLYDNDLIRLQTTCNFIWVPGLQECFQ